MVKFDNKVFKIFKKSQNYNNKKVVLFITKKMFKCMYNLPKFLRIFSCKTFWSTFLVLLFERACCLYMAPHFTISQCVISANFKTFLDKNSVNTWKQTTVRNISSVISVILYSGIKRDLNVTKGKCTNLPVLQFHSCMEWNLLILWSQSKQVQSANLSRVAIHVLKSSSSLKDQQPWPSSYKRSYRLS